MSEKLTKLRALFNEPAALGGLPSIDAYLLPSTDAHQSEYLAEFDFRVKFLSGFSGSNAFSLITRDTALLWTDGRYFLQAEQQLEEGWKLMKQAQPDSILPEDWLIQNLPAGSRVGFDPDIYTFDDARNLMTTLNRFGISVVAIEGNLVDSFWKDRPSLPNKKLIVLSDAETGESVEGKLARVREEISKKKCSAIVLLALDDIMWMLNVRGGDIEYNPLAYSVLFVTLQEAHLFIASLKLDDQIREHLNAVKIHNYEDAASFMRRFAADSNHSQDTVFLPSSTNYTLGNIFGERVYHGTSPVQLTKSRKNAVEMASIRIASIRDSVALVKFFHWLEKEVTEGKSITEDEAGKAIDKLRTHEHNFVDLSFTTISAVGEHAALPHYHPSNGSELVPLSTSAVYLCDSGAHYRDGTTDVTRTVWYGQSVPAEFKKHFTLVLIAHIEMALTVFPSGTNAFRLDMAARQALWQHGLDFAHGVGHGVGHFLNVHETPSITYRKYSVEGNIYDGMVITIEPGLYFPGKWGIRIENCYEIVPAAVESKDPFLTFSSLTLVPILKSLLEESLMENKHKKWLNDYHSRVKTTLLAEMAKRNDCDSSLSHWLEEACAPI